MRRLVPLVWVCLLPVLYSSEGFSSVAMLSAADLVLLASLPICAVTWLRQRALPVTPFDGSLMLLLSSFTLGLLVRWFRVGEFSSYALGNKYLGILLLVGAVYFLVTLVEDADELRRVVDALVFSALVVAALGLEGYAFYKGGVATFLTQGERIHSVMGNANRFGLYMAVTALLATSLAAYGHNRRWMIIAALVGGITVVLSLSRGAWMAYGAGLLVLLALWWSRLGRNAKYGLLAGLLLLIATAMVTTPSLFPSFWEIATRSRSVFARMDSNSAALELISQTPFLGLGLGVTLERLVWFDWAYETSMYLIPHNTALWLWSDLGLPGLVSFSLLSLSFLLVSLRLSRSADPFHAALGRGLAAVYVAFLVFSLAHEALYQRVVWLLFGLAAVAHRLERRNALTVEKRV